MYKLEEGVSFPWKRGFSLAVSRICGEDSLNALSKILLKLLCLGSLDSCWLINKGRLETVIVVRAIGQIYTCSTQTRGNVLVITF